MTRKQLQIQKMRMISEYLKSGKTQRAFIDEQGISLTGLRYWLNKYRRTHSKPVVTNQNNFVEVVASMPEEKNTTDFDIIFPNGVRVNMPSIADGSLLSKVIKSW
jgi:hypothetical protein